MGLYAAPRLLPAGDGAVSVELGDEITREANARVLTLERLLLEARLPGLVETVPTFRSLLVHYDPLVLPWADAPRAAPRAVAAGWRTPPPPPGRRVELPCAYGGELGPDLEEVARRLGLAPARSCGSTRAPSTTSTSSASRPGSRTWPGSPRASPSRGSTARGPRRPPGSVGIGGTQSSIYSVESPGGFWVLGRTPLRLYDPGAAEPILLRAGDRVRFRPIDPAEFDAIAAASRPALPPRIEADA